MNKITIYIRILFVFFFLNVVFSQTPDELKRFIDTYGKIKVDQQANEIVKKGIESEKDPEDGPVRLLVEPADMTDYYREKMNVIKKDLEVLNRLLISSDSVPPLKHFGYNYFLLRDSIQFIDNANVNLDYVLGYGDEVIISIWGQAEQYERAFLDRDGTVFIKNVGLLYLGGKTPSKAKTYVQQRFSKVYSTINSNPPETFLEFSIGKVKDINITLAGHVSFPGNYVINPSMSISNIFVLAGGISETGTLRNIMLQRDGEIVDSLDFYPLITGNGLFRSINILDGDIIIVPPRGKTVAVTGAVLSPAYYEITNDDLKSLLKYTGDINRNGNDQAIIARAQGPNLYVSKDQFENTPLIMGDSLIIPHRAMEMKSIAISVTNRPQIIIPWVEDLSFQKILRIVNVEMNNIRNVELVRLDKENGIQKPHTFQYFENDKFNFLAFDHLSIQLYENFKPHKTVVIKGYVTSPGTYPLINDNETINSILNRSGGLQKLTNINNVIVKRDTLQFGSKTGELVLTPGDTIIAKPFLGTVKVEGEVHNPGNFEWTANNMAKDFLSFAGGLTFRGDKKHIVYITPYGEGMKINVNSKQIILPGSTIRVGEKSLTELNFKPDRFQQISSLITSLVSIAILANTSRN